MYIIYNSDGSIYKKYLNEYIQQGNSYVNAIFIAIIGREPGNYALSAFAKIPDRTNVTLLIIN